MPLNKRELGSLALPAMASADCAETGEGTKCYRLRLLFHYGKRGLHIFTGGLVGAGGRSRATMTLSKAHCLCVPSQNGLLADCPQRQSDTVVRPPSPNTLPCESTISKSPSTLIDPLSLIVSFAPAIPASRLNKLFPILIDFFELLALFDSCFLQRIHEFNRVYSFSK